MGIPLAPDMVEDHHHHEDDAKANGDCQQDRPIARA
jgi:hypothetical protein